MAFEVIDGQRIDWTPEQAAAFDAYRATIKEPVPEIISDRQFYQQLAVQGVIAQADALAAVKVGTIPAALQTLVDALPTEQQFSAEMLLAGATQFARSNPLTAALGAAFGWSNDQIDTFWRAAAGL